jgi:transglutaminase-like putative cysteine protease
MRYAVSHRTSYQYESPVDLADHVAYLRPRPFAGQQVIAAELDIAPKPSRRSSHRDHFGNLVEVFRIEAGHRTLAVTLRAELDVALPAPPMTTQPWEQLRDSLAAPFPQSVEAEEFLHASPLVGLIEEARAYAAPSFLPGRPVLEAAIELTGRIKRDFAYAPGSTDVATPLAEVFAQARGVCQDFAHVQIAGLRALGLAAGYVSGYIRTNPRPGMEGLRGADATHAWVALWCGSDAGWVHLDPTNDMIAHDEHLVLAWGRDFSDVSPLRGMILGGGEHYYNVAVEVRPQAPAEG